MKKKYEIVRPIQFQLLQIKTMLQKKNENKKE